MNLINVCYFDYTALLGVQRLTTTPVNQTGWQAVVNQTDSPKSVRNCCVIEHLVAILCCHFAFSAPEPKAQ